MKELMKHTTSNQEIKIEYNEDNILKFQYLDKVYKNEIKEIFGNSIEPRVENIHGKKIIIINLLRQGDFIFPLHWSPIKFKSWLNEKTGGRNIGLLRNKVEIEKKYFKEYLKSLF